MTREEALERGSRLVPRTREPLQECRTVRLALEDESLPPPDIPTEAETVIYVGVCQALERKSLGRLA